MKTQSRIALSVAALILVAVVWLGTRDALRKQEVTLASSRESNESAGSARKDPPQIPRTREDVNPIADQRELEKLIAEYYHQPVRFLGLVSDEEDRPLPGVFVKATVVRGLLKDDFEQTSFATDSNGMFRINTIGRSLSLSLSKPGYGTVNSEGLVGNAIESYTFGDPRDPYFHNHREDQPVRWKMFRLSDVKQEKFRLSSPISFTDMPVNIQVPDTDTFLSFKCFAEDASVQNGREFGWRVQIECLEGQMQPISGPSEILAPSDGYTAHWEHVVLESEGGQRWSPRLTQWFWIRCEDETYAKVRIRVVATGRQMIAVDGVRNPTKGGKKVFGL